MKNHTSYYDNQSYCNNCHSYSHTFRECPDPIYSHGILCYKGTFPDIKYIFIRRKQSFAFTDFVRARYRPGDEQYILFLLSRMTIEEHSILRDLTFQEVWKIMWAESYKRHIKEMDSCKTHFLGSMKLKSVQDVLKDNKTEFLESEYGIPKGKAFSRETALDCAKREFTEETNISCDDIVFEEIEPFKESHTAFNGKTYISIYYLAKFVGESDELYLEPTNLSQITEIDKIGWYSFEECINLCRSYYTEKMMCLIKANRYIRQIKN